MSTEKLNFRQRVVVETLWFAMRLFAILPYWFKYYVVQNLLFFILYYCVRYRVGVVRENLRRSFPEKSKHELAVIGRRFYLTLSELFVDTLNLAHRNDRKIRSLIRMRNLEEHRETVRGRDWIAMLAHYGCWEYGSYWGYYDPTQLAMSVYHPLRSPVAGCLFERLRAHRGTVTVPMKDSMRFFLRHRDSGADGRNIAMGLIADQNPPKRPGCHWFRFLNQDTIFFDGGEKLALRCGLPVYFVRMERVGRGRYEVSFEQIYDGQEPVAEHEITERYVRHLESMIRERPELWMWSHRRWKHKRTDVDC